MDYLSRPLPQINYFAKPFLMFHNPIVLNRFVVVRRLIISQEIFETGDEFLIDLYQQVTLWKIFKLVCDNSSF
mgnify:CR=1 FL=1